MANLEIKFKDAIGTGTNTITNYKRVNSLYVQKQVYRIV